MTRKPTIATVAEHAGVAMSVYTDCAREKNYSKTHHHNRAKLHFEIHGSPIPRKAPAGDRVNTPEFC